MSIKEADIQVLVADGRGQQEWLLSAAQEMSRGVLERLTNQPEKIPYYLDVAQEAYQKSIDKDRDAIRIFSPLRATAFYIDYFYYTPLYKAARKQNRFIEEDLQYFAEGISHMTEVLLRAEGGLVRGITGQTTRELRDESEYMQKGDQDAYVALHYSSREKITREQADILKEDGDMSLLHQEYNHMASRPRRRMGVETSMAIELAGAGFAVDVYEVVIPYAREKIQGVILK